MTIDKPIHRVFTLTIYRRRPRDLFVLSAAPGVPLPLLAQQSALVERCAAERKADFLLLRDCEVRLVPQPWWGRVRAACRRAMDWLMTDADQKFTALVAALLLCAGTCGAQDRLPDSDYLDGLLRLSVDVGFEVADHGGNLADARNAVALIKKNNVHDMRAFIDALPGKCWKLSYTTNIVESDNQEGMPSGWWVQANYDPRRFDPKYQVPFKAATERTWTTNVVERLTVTLRVNGEDRVLEQDRTVSSRAYTEVLRQDWVPKPAPPPQTNYAGATNAFHWTILTNYSPR